MAAWRRAGRRSASACSCAGTRSSTRTSSSCSGARRRSCSTPGRRRARRARSSTTCASSGRRVVGVVVNSHGHYDHAFGNSVFRPAPIWGHERAAEMIRRTGESQREGAAAEVPEIAAELAEVVLDPPERTFREVATICLDDEREVELRYLGRGHTDNDIVLRVDGADVLCAGDLLENGAPPNFGDGYPMDWPATAEALAGAHRGADGRRPWSRRPRGSRVRGVAARGLPGRVRRRTARLRRRGVGRRCAPAHPLPRGGGPRACPAGSRSAPGRARGIGRGLSPRRGPPSGRVPRPRRSRRAPAPACPGRPR